MGFIKEFKEFALKGNVVDLAVAFIIGAGFNKIVTSLVSDIIMPVVGVLMGGIDFKNYKYIIKHGATAAEDVSVNYGQFIQTLLDFFIIAFAVFLIVKGLNSIRRRRAANEVAEPEPLTKEEMLLTEIRDSIRAGR